MNRAEIGISPWNACCDRKLLVRVERRRFLKLLLDAYDCVRFLVPIDPSYLLSRFNGYGLRIEGEVFDLYSVLLIPGVIRILHFPI